MPSIASRIQGLGIESRIYCSNFGQDRQITPPKHPVRPPIAIRGADFPFPLDRDQARATSGSAQFGSTFDMWGDWFITHNTMRHVILSRQYLARSLLLDPGAAAVEIFGSLPTLGPYVPPATTGLAPGEDTAAARALSREQVRECAPAQSFD
jgi:hypothetical protein